jgi:hypothetical protein
MFNISINQDSGAPCGAYFSYIQQLHMQMQAVVEVRAHTILLWLGAFSPTSAAIRMLCWRVCALAITVRLYFYYSQFTADLIVF